MKKFNKALTIVATLFILLCGKTAIASHQQGADITFSCVGNGYYKIRLAFYRDCTGILPGLPDETIQMVSSCGLATSFVAHLVDTIDATPICDGKRSLDACHGGSLPGVELFVYETDSFQVDSSCEFTASYSSCCRNSGVKNVNQNGMYVETKFYSDSAKGQCDHSPVFFSPPVPFFCTGQAVNYSQAAFDYDGDSLVYNLVDPLQAAGSPVGFLNGADATHPLLGNTLGAFNFDKSTGLIQFTPAATGKYVLAVRVDEYRNGVKIGSTMRDIQINIITCPGNNIPSLYNNFTPQTVISGLIISPTKLQVCPNTKVEFILNATDIDTGQRVNLDSIGSNFPAFLSNFPGATMTFTHHHPGGLVAFPIDTLDIHFTWTPPGSYYGHFSIPLTIHDDNCSNGGTYPGSQTYLFNIDVIKAMDAGPDTVYCIGGAPVTLHVTNTTQQTWSDIGGGAPKGMIQGPASSATIIVAPNIANGDSAVYVVTTNVVGACRTKDTVKVHAAKLFSLHTTATDSTICKYTKTTVTTTPNDPTLNPYSYSWSPAATFASPNSQTTQTNQVDKPGFVYVTAISKQGCAVRDSVPILFKGTAPKVNISPSNNLVCPGDTVTLYGQSVLEGLVVCGPTPGGINNVCPFGSVLGTGDVGASSPNIVYAGGTVSPFKHNANGRMQMLFNSAELQAAGVSSGSITDLAFYVSTKATTAPGYSNYTIKMGCTNLTKLTSSFVTGLTTVSQSNNVNPLVTFPGWNLINLSVTPFDWDGSSNLIIDICWSGAAVGTQDDTVSSVAAPFNGAMNSANSTFTQGCNLTTGVVSGSRPITRINYCSPGVISYKWTPKPLTDDTMPNVSAAITNDITYRLSATYGGCTNDTAIQMKINKATLISLRDTTVCGDSAQLRITYPNYVVPTCVKDYRVDSIGYAAIAGTQTLFKDSDFHLQNGKNYGEGWNSGVAGPYNLPFPFQFYCDTFYQYWVSPNGWISFEDPYTYTTDASQPAQLLPNTPAYPRKMIALYWYDLAFNGYMYQSLAAGCGTIGNLVTGTTPNRIFTVKYNSLCYARYSTPQTMDGEIHLYEKDGHIELMIDSCNITAGSSRTTGLKFESGTGKAAPGRNLVSDLKYSSLGNPHGREAWKFTPLYTGAIPVSYLWTPALGLTSATIDTPKALPPASQKYIVQVTYQNGCKVKDSVHVNIGSFPHTMVAHPSDHVCPGDSPTVILQGSGGVSYQWSPANICVTPTADSTKVFVTDTTKFYITASNTQGCQVKDSITIYTFPTPKLSIKPDKTLCSTDSVTLQLAGTYSQYLWYRIDTLNGTLVAVSNKATLQGKPVNKYQLKVKDANSACFYFTDTVKVDQYPVTTFNATDTFGLTQVDICAPAQVVLKSAPNTINNINWQPSGGTSATMVATNSGNYFFTAKDLHGCGYTSNTVKVTINSAPTINVFQTKNPICDNGIDTMTAHIGGLNDTYRWVLSTGNVPDTIYPATDSGRYVFLASYKGCATFDTVLVRKATSPVVTLGNDKNSCKCGDQVNLSSNVVGTTYTWSPAQTSNTAAVTVTQNNSGTYKLTVTDANGCTGSASVTVNIHCLTVAGHASKDTVLSANLDTLTATSSYTNGVNYQWEPADSVASPTFANTLLNGNLQSGPQTFVITATDVANGCVATDTVRIIILAGGGDTMAMAFSPNGDGLNDTLYPKLKGGSQSSTKVATFHIYDRWGQMLWQDNEKGWDGTYQGLAQPVGTYFYFLQTTAPDPLNPSQRLTKSYQGSIELIR